MTAAGEREDEAAAKSLAEGAAKSMLKEFSSA